MVDETSTSVPAGVTFTSGGSFCSGTLYLPAGVKSPPLVILGHGVGATREMGLDSFALRFSASGLAALTFTYRHFGDSGGEPRQLLSVSDQLQDWESAITYAKGLAGVDGNRLCIWGTSFGGGLVIEIASRHPELAAAVSQCPFTDGIASARTVGVWPSVKMFPKLLADLGSMVAGRGGSTVAVVGSPGAAALMNAPDAMPGYLALIPDDLQVSTRMLARSIVEIVRFRPGRSARKVRCPVLFCVSEIDSVAPTGPTMRYCSQAPRGEIRTYSGGHFDFYSGDTFEMLAEDQTEFLLRSLGVARGGSGDAEPFE